MKDIILMTRVYELLYQMLDDELKKNKIDMKCSHMGVVFLVNSSDGRANIKDIVKNLGKKKSTVTEMINSLEKKGYLKKYQSEEDKRIYYVESTEKAKEVESTIKSMMNNAGEKLKSSFSNAEQAMLTEFLERMYFNLSNE